MTTNKLSFDSNILIYSIDSRDPVKHATAASLIERCIQADGLITLQCLTEFYQAATRKKILSKSLAYDVALETQQALTVVSASEKDFLDAMNQNQLHRVQFFDALMRSTVERAGATILFSEDFSHHDTYRKLTILNPFVMSDLQLEDVLS